jgi:nicotinate phosphoribosyltransferase
VGGAIADAPMIDYSLDIVEVADVDRSKRGKRGGRKRLLNLQVGARVILPESATIPEGATDVLIPLEEMYSPPPAMDTLRQRVLDQLGTVQL